MNNKSSFINIINKEGYLLYPFKGISMLPLLEEDNDLVRIEKGENYNKYDVVLYKNEKKQFVLHRIIDIKEGVYALKGDNTVNVEFCHYQDILGRMVGFFHKDTYISVEDDMYKKYLNDYIINKKYKKKKPIYREDVSRTSFTVNDPIKKAYRSLFIYCVACDSFDISYIKSLTNEEFNIFYKLCLAKKSEHILKTILDEYHLNDIDEKIMVQLDKAINIVKSRYLFHDYYLKELSLLFNDNHIKHIFIKGAEVINSFSNPLLRASNDIDVYIDKSDLDKVTELLKRKYHIQSIKDESIHRSFSIMQGKLLLEVHYKLLEEDMDNINALIGNPFDHSYSDEKLPYRFHLDNDYYHLYHLAHFAKHLKHGEFWMSMMIDSFILQNESNELVKGARLDKFNDSLNQVMSFWANNQESTKEVEGFESIVFMDALSSYVALKKEKHHSRIGYILSRIFITKEELTDYYPSLRNRWFLYPFYLLKRLFKSLFTKNIRKPLEELKLYNKNDISFNRYLETIGIYNK